MKPETPRRRLIACVLLTCLTSFAFAAGFPEAENGDFVLKDFHFASGETLPELRMHYRTVGHPKQNEQNQVTNAVIIMHGTTGSSMQFMNAGFAGELFCNGQPLDAQSYFLILPDAIGHGQSSKPSDGLHAHFPRYGYRDQIEAQYRLVTEGLKINHLRLVMGTSMGGMHTWLWGEMHPDFMDALLPLASLPDQISGRNRVWRRMIIDSIRNDRDWNQGDYKTQPPGLKVALEVLFFIGNNPVERYREAPTLEAADKRLDSYVDSLMKTSDANDVLYAVESSRDYDPAPDLERIKAPLLAINFVDDLINPPELNILERQIPRVPHGRALMVPMSDKTRGHGTHTLAAIWKAQLVSLLQETQSPTPRANP